MQSQDRVFFPREVPSASFVSPLSRSDAPFPVQYLYNGQTLSLGDFLKRQRITGLLILKGNSIVFKQYQYDRQPEQRVTSMSMAKTMTSLLIGIAVKEGKIASLDATTSLVRS